MSTTLNPKTYQQFCELMFESIGLSLGDNKQSLVSSRLSPRISRLGLESFERYFELINSDDDAGEFQMAVDLLTTNETYFFREPEHFAFLEQDLVRRKLPTLRIWSAASSFGDEAYSIAMLLSDLQTMGRITADWSIVGTDISDRVLRSAVEGIYPEDRLRLVTPERLKRYCLRGEGDADGLVQIHPKVRERVQFGQLNLMLPLDGWGDFDAIFLRNVLIYFDHPTKKAVMDRVLAHLKPGGLLFVGTAEGRIPCTPVVAWVAPGVLRKPAP